MAKIIRFPNARTATHFAIPDAIAELARMWAEGSATSFVGALKHEDGTVATVYANADWGTRMELVGHMQADVFGAMVEANSDE